MVPRKYFLQQDAIGSLFDSLLVSIFAALAWKLDLEQNI